VIRIVKHGLGDRAVWARLPDLVRARLPDLVRALDRVAIRVFDWVVAFLLLLLLAPVIAATAVAIKVDSSGPVFYRCRRAGYGGSPFAMLKFRKMADGADGPPLTAPEDERFTRFGRFLAQWKLDEIPQLWNVLRGEMSLVGPRPEDLSLIASRRSDFDPVLAVKPGITGLSQLVFVRESEMLDPEDRVGDYLARILPQKIQLDALYAGNRSLLLNLRILRWTAVVILTDLKVAVHRESSGLGVRPRPAPRLASVASPTFAAGSTERFAPAKAGS
jgi:lipopolysaccharide/colanic/teichoic acid biosynthesis glycosyltransferase